MLNETYTKTEAKFLRPTVSARPVGPDLQNILRFITRLSCVYCRIDLQLSSFVRMSQVSLGTLSQTILRFSK